MAKRGWKCVIPGCTSLSTALAHYFPKNEDLMKQWLAAISVPWISNLPKEEIRKCRICHLHFNENEYIYSTHRRRLKHDLFHIRNDSNTYQPNNMVQEGSITDSQVDTSHIQLQNVITELPQPSISQQVNDEIQENIAEYCQPGTSKEEIVCNYNTLEKDTSQEMQQSTPEIIKNPTSVHKSNICTRNILGNISRQGNLTPLARRLYAKSRSIQIQRNSLRHKIISYKQRLKYARQLSNHKFFKAYTALSSTQKTFIDMQMKNVNRPAKVNMSMFYAQLKAALKEICKNEEHIAQYLDNGVRFTLNEKILALSLYKHSQAGYALLQQLFTLPSGRTLRRLLQKVPIHAGINRIIFEHLSQQQAIMKDVNDKLCILMWDEMALQPHLYYDQLNDKIVGFEDWGHKRTQSIADHALVFLLRGIKTGWKIPLTYNFCKSQTKTPQLIRCIKEIVKEIAKSQFIIVAVVCDQGSSNMAALNQLLNDSRTNCLKTGEQFDDTITIHGQNIIVLYDPPHLLKGIRNNFLVKDIEIDFIENNAVHRKGIASWDIIETAYDINVHTNILNRQLQKLTEQHIRKNKINKMKVKLASQVFSSTLSAFIEYNSYMRDYIDTNIGPLRIPKEEGFATAKVLDFFNKLFDSVNAHQIKSNIPLRAAVMKNSAHHSFWAQAIRQLQHIKFINKMTRQLVCIPSLKNWITTIQGFQKVWVRVNDTGMNYLKIRNINQNPLENFFGVLRSHNRRNINPTCANFESSYKTLLINNLSGPRSVGSNCEKDKTEKVLFSLQTFIETILSIDNTSTISEEIETVNIDDTSVQSNVAIYSKTFCIQQLLRCEIFKNCPTCTNIISSQALTDLISRIHNTFNNNMPSICFRTGVCKRLNAIIADDIDFSCFTCEEHKSLLQNTLIEIITQKSSIARWCENINRKLNGKDISKAHNIMERQAVHMFCTRYKTNK